jgi:hypothetical protein
MHDAVTGARADVTLTVGMSAERLWELVTDVTRIGEWSPECTHAAWLDADAPGPRAGARFEARNRYADGFVSSVVCVVTEAVRPVTFGWVVLDDRGDPAHPGSIWRYELAPNEKPGRTLLRQSFAHGPGNTGTREGWRRDPASLAGRLEGLRANMRATLAAMTEDAQEEKDGER